MDAQYFAGFAGGSAEIWAVGIWRSLQSGRDRGTKESSPGTRNKCRVSPLGPAHPVPVDEEMAGESSGAGRKMNDLLQRRWFVFVLVTVIVGAIYLGCVVSPPSLMDDVDAVQA